MHYLSLEKAGKKVSETSKDRNTKISKLMGCSKSGSKNEVYNNKYLYQKDLINNLTLYLKKLEREQTKPKVSGKEWKEITKIRVKTDTTKTIEKKSMKLRLTFRKDKIDKFLAWLQKRERRFEQMKSEMKEEILQLLIQKY